MLLIIFTGIVVILVHYFLHLPFKYWERLGIPSAPASIIFGNIAEVVFMKKNQGQVYDEIYNKYPELSYVGVYKGKNPCILLRDVELVKHVLVKSFNNFHNNEMVIDEKADPLFSKNAFVARGDKWKQVRGQVTPSFTVKRMKAIYPLTDAICKNMIEYINNRIDRNDACLEVKDLCSLFTTDNVTSCALGLDSNCLKNPKSDYIMMCKKMLWPSFWSTVRMILLLSFPAVATLMNTGFIPTDVANYFTNVVVSALEYRKNNNIFRDDFLDTMQELQNKLGNKVFTIDDITAHVIGFYIDGFETSAVVLCFILYELGLHPDIKETLEKEIHEVRQKNQGSLSYEALQEMPYLDKIINESMRKHTTVLVSTRICTEAFTFPPPNGKGPNLSVKVGTPVIIPLHSIHHDPKYFPDPFRFDPERFSAENIRKINKFSYLPFGEGPRVCLGQRFGILQTKVALVNLVSNFKIGINPRTRVPYEIDPRHFLLAAKGGIWLDFYKKEKTE